MSIPFSVGAGFAFLTIGSALAGSGVWFGKLALGAALFIGIVWTGVAIRSHQRRR